MGQILSSISGSETTSPKKTTPSYSSRQFDQYSQYDYTQRKSESTFSTFQPSYDTEWSKRLRQAREREAERLREQEAERLRQARRAREQQEAERLRQAIRAREQQEAERLRQARQAREQEAERLRQAREREVIKLFLAGKREKASQVTKNTTSLSNRSYNNVTSGTKNNAPYNVVASSGIKTTSVVIPKVTSGTKENTTSTSEENTTSLSKEDRDNIKRITEIVRNVLTRDKNYVVYGNWSCPHWPNSCNNEDEWQRKYSLESFRRYLKLDQKSKKDFFMNECKGCDKKSLVTSFFLYNRQPTYASKEPSVEIVCRLEWNNHYRVFADWKCKRPQHPQHEWKSSYTWISLRNYIENSQLKEGDYYVQKCYDCREECKVCKKKPKEERGCKKCDHDTVILKRSPLVQSTGGKPHKRWLCAKCKGGSICRTDNNYRVPRRRNIELLE